ncbi:MAG TPA: hypothetical protein VM285_00305 [Polyangia bacterium]|nr:hypothetical protein [Polyangia bacterium]
MRTTFFFILGALCLAAGNATAQEEGAGEAAPEAEATEGSGEAGADAGVGEEAAVEGDAGPVEGGVEPAAEETTEPAAEAQADPASSPPEVAPLANSNALRTRLSGRSRSEMFFSQRPRMTDLGGGRYGVRTADVFPFYETLELRADEIGHKGLSIHFQGWAGLDLADVYFDQRFVADPTYLYLQFRDYGADFKVGRQQVYTGAARGLHLDGAHLSYETPIHLGVEVLGGLVVSPYRGPEWYREQPANLGYDDFGAGFSDWERDGDYAAGGRIFYRVAGKVSAGFSLLHVTELHEIDRQLFGAELDTTPVKWLGATAGAVMDIQSAKLQDANLGLDFYPHEVLSFGVDYRHADPTLYLSQMSIFSVFSTEEYDAVGGTVRLSPLSWLGFDAGYHHRFYSWIEQQQAADGSEEYGATVDQGYELLVGAAARFAGQQGGLVRLDYRRLGQEEQGLHQVRLGAAVPVGVPGLKAAANAYLDFYDEKVNSADTGLLGDVGLFWISGPFDVGGSFAAGLTPFAEHELRGMVRFIYRFDVSFVEQRPQS